MGSLDFFLLVREMRAAQKEYFRTRAQSALVKSKDLEHRVDGYLARGDQYLKLQQQLSLFKDRVINGTLYHRHKKQNT